MSSYLTVEALIAPCSLFLLLLLASRSFILTFIILGILIPGTSILINRYHPNVRFNSNFYLSWTISSYILLVTVFEFEVVPYLEILIYENAFFLLLAGATLFISLIVRYKSREHLVQSMVSPKTFKRTYCSWLKCTIDSSNIGTFILGCFVAIIALLYSADLMLTTVCHVTEIQILSIGNMLLPYDCSDVYLESQ